MSDNRETITRRELLAASALAGLGGALLASPVLADRAALTVIEDLDFSRSGWGGGWSTSGVANLRRSGAEGLLEAGSDVFPNDPRPVAFVNDRRTRDVSIQATITRVGGAPGLVVRRTGPTSYYAVIYESEQLALRLVRRVGHNLSELARSPVLLARPPLRIELTALGTRPTRLRAQLVDADGRVSVTSASDATLALQRAGDAGVLASAETLFPSDRNPVLPALGNIHLLPYGVQEGQVVLDTAVGKALLAEIRRRSSAGFGRIVIRSAERPRPTSPSVLAATTGVPVRGGARLHVASDVDFDATVEVSYTPSFDDPRVVRVGRSDRFRAASVLVRDLEPGRRVHWRARLRRGSTTTTGPERSFVVMPTEASERELRIAVVCCAAQFGPVFEQLAATRPHVLVWQGDLNYPDTHGPLAQTVSGYAGVWRDFLRNPLLGPLFERAAFAPQRDDHDYGAQDAYSATIKRTPWAVGPWEHLMNRRIFYRFPAGAAEFWVLDQRRYKSDPTDPDSAAKTLLGDRQRRWLFRTLAASRASFKVICSPTTVFLPGNARDGGWSTGYGHERTRLLEHIRTRVRGKTLFLTGDTHLTGVYEGADGFEARPAPTGIPTPNDVTLTDPLAAAKLRARQGVAYADDRCHFALVKITGRDLVLSLRREDGSEPYSARFAGRH